LQAAYTQPMRIAIGRLYWINKGDNVDDKASERSADEVANSHAAGRGQIGSARFDLCV